MRGLPVRYLPWMARDVARGPGVGMLVVGAMSAYLASGMTIVSDGRIAGPGTEVLLTVTDFAATVFVLLATAGMVSADFAGGWYRALFARPLSAPAYYFQRWLVGGLAVLIATAAVALTAAARVGAEVPIAALVGGTALGYLLLGGLVFLLSTFTRYDWLVAVVLFAAHGALGVARSFGFGLGAVARTLYAVLPPFHLVGLDQPLPSGAHLLHAAGYGIALVLGALLVLRRRPLARGARE
ncbi:MAG TPA: hypothetical protein VFU46_08205 [Gemmatimonadales bacterium]|nr:hypothetical protein [Gemmatimonadales bacterium]